MKNFRTTAICVCISVYSLCAAAQNNNPIPVNEPDLNKPKLFQGMPDNIPVSLDNLNGLINGQPGLAISLSLSATAPLHFEGEVVSAASKYGNSIRSVVIRSTNFNGARFTISKITGEDGTTLYRGRILSLQHGDLYELQNKNGNYSLVKKNFYDLVNE
jgi:hypothetical protein